MQRTSCLWTPETGFAVISHLRRPYLILHCLVLRRIIWHVSMPIFFDKVNLKQKFSHTKAAVTKPLYQTAVCVLCIFTRGYWTWKGLWAPPLGSPVGCTKVHRLLRHCQQSSLMFTSSIGVKCRSGKTPLLRLKWIVGLTGPRAQTVRVQPFSTCLRVFLKMVSMGYMAVEEWQPKNWLQCYRRDLFPLWQCDLEKNSQVTWIRGRKRKMSHIPHVLSVF